MKELVMLKRVDMHFFRCLLVMIVLSPVAVFAQESIPGQTIICYGADSNNDAHVTGPSPAAILRTTATKTSDFQITYTGFPDAARQAFQYAIDIWKNVLYSNVPINVNATWTSLQGNVLATTRPTKLYRGFAGAVQADVWYPVSLAEKITGTALNETTASDIEISVNSNMNWYFDTDGNTTANHTDLVTVILHEIAHGLGFTSSATVKDNLGYLRDENYLSIYDLLLENNKRERLSLYVDPSQQLEAQLTSNAVYLFSPTSVTDTGTYPKIFAPGSFIAGSSISHLDESEYPPGNANALMTPYFNQRESVHALGIILLGVLNDLGWRDYHQESYSAMVYPNPGNGVYKLKLNLPVSTSSVQLVIADVTGKIVERETLLLQLPESEIDISDKPAGMYIVKITTPELTFVRKIISLK